MQFEELFMIIINRLPNPMVPLKPVARLRFFSILKRLFTAVTIAVVLSALISCATPPVPETADVVTRPVIIQNNAVSGSVRKPKPAPKSASIPEPELPRNPFIQIDRNVRKLAPSAQRSIPELVSALRDIAETDWEKTRAVYIWITQNIAYDTDSYFRGVRGATDAAGVFSTGKSVCEGYSNLFLEIGSGLGLEVVNIHGYAKGYGYREGVDTGGTNHAWNGVRIDGQWQLFDATWGAGYVNGRDFTFKYNEFYFAPPPDQFIFSHLPSDPTFQLTTRPVDRKLFFRLPNLDDDAFIAGLDALEIRTIVETGGDFGMPVIYPCDIPAELVEFPMLSTLKAGRSYRIIIETPSRFALVSDSAGNKDILENRRGRIVIEGSYPRGKMGVYLAPLEARDAYSHSYDGFLKYQVE